MLTFGVLCLLIVKEAVSNVWYSNADHYWNLDTIWSNTFYEPYRHTVHDNVTERWAATVKGNVEVIPSVRGVGASLDGATGWIDFGTRHNSCFVDVKFCQKGMSVALWVKAKEQGVHNTSVILLFGRGDSGLKIAYTKYGRIELSITSGLLRKAWRLTTLNNTVEPSIWYHVLFTWSINNGTNMFINGTRLSNVSLKEKHLANETCQTFDKCSIDWQLTVGKSISPLSYSEIQLDELTLWSTVVDNETIKQAAGDIEALPRSNSGCSWGWFPHLQWCYRIVSSPTSWDEGQVACEENLSNLASIGNLEELQILEKHINKIGVSSCLSIGMRQSDVDGTYKWVDDNVGIFMNSIVTTNYSANDSHCVQRMTDGAWRGGNCSTLCGFICKKKREYTLRNANYYCRAKKRDMAMVKQRVRIRLVESELECAMECLIYGTSCRSYNFRYTDNYPYLAVSGDYLCELNKENHVTSPDSLVPRDGYQYCERL